MNEHCSSKETIYLIVTPLCNILFYKYCKIFPSSSLFQFVIFFALNTMYMHSMRQLNVRSLVKINSMYSLFTCRGNF